MPVQAVIQGNKIIKPPRPRKTPALKNKTTNKYKQIENTLVKKFGISAVFASNAVSSFIINSGFSDFSSFNLALNVKSNKNNPVLRKKLYDFLNEKLGSGIPNLSPTFTRAETPPPPPPPAGEGKNDENNNSSKKNDYLSKISGVFITGIKNNSAPWMVPWKADDYLNPQNPVTGSVYSGFNNLYLEYVTSAVLRSKDPRWFTYKNVQELGLYVKKCSKGCPVSYYNTVSLDKDGKLTDDPALIEKHKTVQKLYFVFHASQIEGIPPYSHPKEDEYKLKDSQVIEKAEIILSNSGAVIFHDSVNKNFYLPSKDEIHLTPKHTFFSLPEYYCTALHELAHWTGHPSRLNREISGFKDEKYAKEELRAEIASYMLCKELRLDFKPQNSIAYVQSWSNMLQNNETEILKACHDASKIKDFCLSFSNSVSLQNNKNNAKQLKGRSL